MPRKSSFNSSVVDENSTKYRVIEEAVPLIDDQRELISTLKHERNSALYLLAVVTVYTLLF